MSLAWCITIGALAIFILFLAYGYIMFRRKYLTDKPEAFRSNIEAYRRMDAKAYPAEGKVLFLGSSVMEFWRTVEADLAPLPVLNRAIAGSKIVQWPHYAEELVLPHRPRAVVLYAGSNDMHGKNCKSPRQILDAFAEFADKVHAALPETTVYFLSILPSPNKARWANWGRIREANELIKDYAKSNANLGLIDCTDEFLREGLPRPELFRSDGVHLNAKGYEIWKRIIRDVFAQ